MSHVAPGTLLLVQDETDLLLFPPLRAAWAPVGQQATVRLSGYNAKRVLFGALDLRTGTRYLRSRSRNRADDFCAFLTWLRTQEPDRPILMLLDDGPSHTARKSRQTASELGIELVPLPHRSPELNPLESLWRLGKQVVCANRQYRDILDELLAVIDYLQGLSNAEALEKSGVLSPTFWLRHQRSK